MIVPHLLIFVAIISNGVKADCFLDEFSRSYATLASSEEICAIHCSIPRCSAYHFYLYEGVCEMEFGLSMRALWKGDNKICFFTKNGDERQVYAPLSQVVSESLKEK